MGRTKLRALEVAGIRMGIEVPSGYDWRWPRGSVSDFEVAAHAVDVHVGVRIGCGHGIEGDEVPWTFRGRDAWLDLARTSEGWTAVAHGAIRCERVACFEGSFASGDVLVDPEVAAAGTFPLAEPLGELVWLHRIVGSGGLLVSGSVRLRDGHATLILPCSDRGEARVTDLRIAGDRGEAESRVALRIDDSGDVLAFDTPWGRRAIGRPAAPVRVDSIHLLEHALEPYVETADSDEAAERLIAQAFAPVHDAALAERAMSTAARIAHRSTLRIVGLPGLPTESPSELDVSWTARPFAPPRWI